MILYAFQIYCTHIPLLRQPLSPLAIPVAKKVEMRPHHHGILDKLLHAIHETVSVRARHQPAAALEGLGFGVVGGDSVGELRVGHGDGTLVRDGEHAHPAPEDA